MSSNTETLWKELMNHKPGGDESVFFEYCESIITEKEQDGLSVEAAAYKICGLIQKNFSDEVEEIVSYACELEIPREMSKGAGINIGEKWDADAVAVYKEKGWQELVRMIRHRK